VELGVLQGFPCLLLSGLGCVRTADVVVDVIPGKDAPAGSSEGSQRTGLQPEEAGHRPAVGPDYGQGIPSNAALK
jgi:hypothetical protein